MQDKAVKPSLKYPFSTRVRKKIDNIGLQVFSTNTPKYPHQVICYVLDVSGAFAQRRKHDRAALRYKSLARTGTRIVKKAISVIGIIRNVAMVIILPE